MKFDAHGTKHFKISPIGKPFFSIDERVQMKKINFAHLSKERADGSFAIPLSREGILYAVEGIKGETHHTERFKVIYGKYKADEAEEAYLIAYRESLTPKKLEELKSCYNFKTTPYTHQIEAFEISKDAKEFGFFMEMGTGKTKVGIDTITYLWEKGLIEAVLIVAPVGVREQWVEEQFATHLSDSVEHDVLLLRSKKKEAIAFVEQPKKRLKVISATVTTFSRSDWKVALMDAYLQTHKTLFLLDESSKIKNSTALRTQALVKLAVKAEYRRIFTGSPVTRGIEDLYSQFCFLKPSIIDSPSIYAFKTRYCITGRNNEIVGYREVETLKKKIAKYSFQCSKENCLDLPEKVYQVVKVELTSEQETIYKQVKDSFLAEINGKEIELPLAIARMSKLRQITNGWILDEEQVCHNVSTNRPQILKSIVDELYGKKVVIWCDFRRDIEILENELRGYGLVSYHGKTTQQERQNNLERFKTDPDCQIFLANPTVGGYGIDGLQKVCSTAIYYSNSFSAEIRWQSEDRLHRVGQKVSVNYIDLVAEKTLDRKILVALRNKLSLASLIKDKPALTEFIN